MSGIQPYLNQVEEYLRPLSQFHLHKTEGNHFEYPGLSLLHQLAEAS